MTYEWVSKAPTFGDIERRVGDGNIDAAMRLEAEKLYLAKDSTGKKFLIQNPALMTYQVWKGAGIVTRKTPIPFDERGSTTNADNEL